MLKILSIFIFVTTIIIGIIIGLFFLFRKNNNKLADWLFIGLLSVFNFHCINLVLDKFGLFERHPRLYFLPVYFTLAFGPMLFFYSKARLFPKFRLKKSDLKHFIAPIGQASFFCLMFFNNVEIKRYNWENDYNPFYGTFGFPIYVLIFYTYFYFAYRFVKFRLAALRHIDHEENDFQTAFRLKKMMQVLLLLMIGNTTYVVINFLTYKFLKWNINNSNLISFLGDMSYIALVLWIEWYGLRVLWNTKSKNA